MGLSKDFHASRTVSFMQYLTVPETGEKLLDLQELRESLQKHHGIKRWAFIVHNPNTSKAHVHGIATQIDDAKPSLKPKPKSRSAWAKNLGIPEQYVWKITDGEAGIADSLGYMLHEKYFCDAEKATDPYSPDDMQAKPGWNWWPLVQDRQTNKASISSSPAFSTPKSKPKRSIRGQMMHGLSYREARNQSNFREYELRNWRNEYLNSAPVPPVRVNFFVDISGVPDLQRKPIIRELASMVSASNSAFELPVWVRHEEYGREARFSWSDYDGEEAIVVKNLIAENDREDQDERPSMGDVCDAYGTPADFFAALSEAPKPTEKVFGNGIHLIHRSHLFVSTSSFEDVRSDLERLYVDNLTAPTEDSIDASHVHLPVFIAIDAQQIGVQILSRYVDSTAHNRRAYLQFSNIRNNFTKIMQAGSQTQDENLGKRALSQGLQQQFAPVTDAKNKVENEILPPITDPEKFVNSLNWDVD